MTDFLKFINCFYEMESDVCDTVKKHNLCSGGEYLSAFSKNVTDYSFNHVVPIGNVKPRDIMIAAQNEFNMRNREPVVYVTPLCNEYPCSDNDLQLVSGDAWMIFEGKKIFAVESNDITVRVATKDDIDNYINVFYKGFSTGVYADLESGYAITERNAFDNPYKTKLMAFYKEKPIGVISADAKDDMAYIESFAVLPEYRRGGETARILGNAAIKTCYDKGANNIFLITAAGTALERIYKSNGFSTKFYGYFYKWRKQS